ncbi:phosphate signaling complex protein PhoU [Tepidibacillus fermentans]|uniref:Phosphate-specific transport system accessory protein PhoU n=1 Tax=Tepidibacillus fermentans TaxID=1281767 RepID=A0A4R3KIU2_9BACI|nr:phosphate signaling complex protein PhoU [Tepidibacillus fermentans]TCS83537.1 phosphate transport system protein [Tepidibacillus fermentans]
MHRKTFDQELNNLQQKLVHMGQFVEQALERALESLSNLNRELARKVVDDDIKVNEMEAEIEMLALQLIATQQPVAKDLRKIIAAIKIASSLERMADLSVDIAKVTIRIQEDQLMKPLIDIPKMAEMVKEMLANGIESYIHEKVELAFGLAEIDDRVDKLYSQVLRDLLEIMTERPETLSQAMLLSFVARYIERIGDHATNIGESVIYLVKGKKPDLNL